jgi:hypothetical protein
VELASNPGEPKSYREAMYSKEKEKWIPAIKNEIENFLSQNIWTPTSNKELRLKNRKPIQTQWIFKKKLEQDRSMQYKARIVAKGYVQIPGVDYTHTHSPVASDLSIWIIIGLLLYMNWKLTMINIEAAFLEADIEEEVYID